MTNPLVSIVVPAYQAEASIAATLEQAGNQTYRPIEIVVVDDGSPDGTAAAAGAVPGVRCIRQDNAGPSAARNTGIRAAKGDFIAFLDADDLWLPDKLERQMALFAAHPELDLVFTDAEITRPDSAGRRSFFIFAEKGLGKTYFGSEWELKSAVDKLLKDNFIATSSVVARRSLFTRLEFNASRRYAEDWELWLKAATQGAIGFVDAVCVRKIEDGCGLSARRREMLLARIDVFETFVAENRSRIALTDAELQTLLKDQFRWAGYFLERFGDAANARACYLKALRLRFDARTFLRYLLCRIRPAAARSDREPRP
jgi:glycosyltransferase involved in cell wall biosynthesis